MTTSATLPAATTVPGRGRPRRLHATAGGGIDIARELGVQYRAYCGRWIWPTMPTRDIKRRDLTDPSPRHCKDCVAVIQGRRRPA